MFTKEPIRKRGYYRALKAGKQWAVLKKSMIEIMNAMYRDLFNEIITPNPFMKMIGLKDMMEPMNIKIVTGLKPAEKKD